LDALLKNRSEIHPDTLHADTQGQSEPVFGLCRQLGIKLMPRMRGLSDALFYRPSKGIRYRNIDAPLREFSNDFLSKAIGTMLPTRPGIDAGRHDVQRLLYYTVIKCY